MEKTGRPLPAQDLVPHRPPMLLIDRLLEGNEQGGVAETVIRPDHLFLQGGRLHPAALMEILAQSFAAVKGYTDRKQGKKPAEGFLVGVRNLKVYASPQVGDRLSVTINRAGETDEFTWAEGTVQRGTELLAEGTVMVFVPKGS